jgi:hypothetical protein
MNLFLLVSPGTALRAMDIVFNLSLPYISFVKSMNILHKNVLTSSVVDRGFEPRLGQTKDYKIGTRQNHGENKLIFNEMMMRSALY